MDFDRIYALALAECDYLKAAECPKIYITSAVDNTDYSVSGNFKEAINRRGIKAKVISTGSFGYFDLEPLALIEKPGQPGIFYRNVTPEIASDLVNDYLLNNTSRSELALGCTGSDKLNNIPYISELPLFGLQNRIALRNCGYVDPEDINHYICRNGFRGLSRALQMKPQDVIEEIRNSELRGRGGAGYPTDIKWQICHDAAVSEKYLVCDAMDADPKALTARLLLESDPYSVLEGMLIAAWAVGASHSFICINTGYSLAVKRLNKALEQMKKYSLLYNNILDSAFSCEIEIKNVATSLVAGEETALLRSLEGKPVMPHLRPPYPAVNGFKDMPTLVNNLETLANVSAIFQNGPDWFSRIGTAQSRGSKVMTLSGDVIHKYVVEIPFGTTLKNLINNIGGGVPDGKSLKAVQVGGPTGAFLNSLDFQVDYETTTAGGTIGSGRVDVFDSDSCAVEMARDLISYLQAQSCGECVFCREGSYQMSKILTDISENNGSHADLGLLSELGEGMKLGCICGLGRALPNPVLSSLGLFRHDYDAHIQRKICPVKKD